MIDKTHRLVNFSYETLVGEGYPSVKTIWTYWNSENPPEIIEKCIKNWNTVGKCQDIRVLNNKNITEYIPRSELDIIDKKSPNLANKSDFVGLYLLLKYGGTWIDASVFLHKPLFSWLPSDEFFCYRADRFSKDSLCMENFFIHAPKNHPVCRAWYDGLKQESVDINEFLKRIKSKYPNIDDSMGSNAEYLWAYLVGKTLLLENPELKQLVHSKSAEKGPYLESVKMDWDAKKICAKLEKGLCKNCNMTKLYNDTRNECSSKIIN